jgi:tape measure domain-containing protein
MAQYNIQFSSNASAISKQLSQLQADIARLGITRTDIKLKLDTADFTRAIDSSFKELDKAISKVERRLRKLSIGSPEFTMAAEQSGQLRGERERGRMMASAIGSREAAQAFDTGSLARYERALESLRIQASLIAPNTREWVNLQQNIGAIRGEMQKASKTAESIQLRETLGAFSPGSLNQLQARLTILKTRAYDITPNTAAWKQLNKEIQRTEGSIKKLSRSPLTMGQRAGAAGGAFLYGGGMGGGAGSALAGIAGGIMGGPPGAFAGAAVGQALDNVGEALAGISRQAATIQQLQRGLAMASVDAKDFAEAQETVAAMSSRILMPMEQTLRMFTQLRVNTKEYNLSVEETARIMEGTALAIQSTGGSSQDLEGAMRAVVQIMSKGSVQAEELRGQLGERFPGAVVKFAQANKMSFEELQKALQQGKVGIAEFIAFAEQNYEDYAQFSEQLATAPEFAGQRLAIAFEQMQIAVGSTMGEAGAIIQDAIAGWLEEMTRFATDNKETLQQLFKDFAYIFKAIVQVVQGAAHLIREALVPVVRFIQGLIRDARIALNFAGAAQYKSKLGSIDAEIAAADETGDVRALGRIAALKKQRAEIEKLFKGAGGEAALAAEPLTFGGPGAGVSTEASSNEETKNKKDSLESFERLRDQLANAYNRAEIERIKTRYELEKRLREDLFSMQEFGANRLQRQNLQFLRALVSAEQDRFEANLNAQLNIAQEAGRVDQSAAITAASGGGSGSISIVEFGKALQQMGFTVREHPEFGGVGRHSQNSYHYSGEALDITDWRSGDWMGRTKELGEALRQSGSAAEIFHPGYDPVGGHDTHVHAAFRGGRVPLTPGIQSLMQGQIGAGAPRKVEGSESRQTMAAAQTDIARSAALETERASALMKSSAQLRELARYTQQAYNIPDLLLDTQLQKKRNDLLEEGADEDIINYRLRLYEIDLQRQHLLKVLPQFIKDANMSEQDRVNMEELLAKAFDAAKEAERQKNDETERGNKIRSGIEVKEYIDRLRNEIALLQAATEAERQRLQIQQDYPAATPEQQLQIINLQETKKDLEEVRRAIDDLVSSTVSDYKGFFKSVLFGEDPVEALKEFQKRLADKTLTLFLDFAMAPVEQFFKENLFNLFKPEESKEVAAATSNTSALDKNTAAIEANTAAQGGQAPTSAMTSVPGVGNTPTSSLFSMGGLGSQAVNAPMAIDIAAFGGASSAIDSLNESVYSMGDAIPSFKDSLGNITDTVYKASEETNAQGATFSENLGKAVGAIGIAATSVMGIAAGISQIKEGGASNVLGGIGSVLLGIGGAMGGFGKLFPGKAAANGAVWQGGFTAFANGGVVNGPTLGLVGEGKYNEAIVPLPDGRSIPVKMAGSSSRDLINNQSSSQSSSPVLSMSFETTRFGDVDYVNVEQLQRAMEETRRVAVRDGASRGASTALDRLQNSPAARRKIGLR